jgi:peptidoglycan/xylan/chitin deacetylase (PgdA/CDA1 family)
MTAEHLKDLAANGHMICPHTHSHVFLRDIRKHATAQTELVRPKEILEEMLNRKVRAFAFPVGTERQVGPLAYDYIRKHYDFCFTALFGVNTKETDPYFLRRDCLPAEAPRFYAKTALSGAYDLYYLLKMRRLISRCAYKDSAETRITR